MSGLIWLNMAPLHHHFEKKGWSETKVVIRFWIITGLCAGLGFAVMESFMDKVRVRSVPGKGTSVTMDKFIKGRGDGQG